MHDASLSPSNIAATTTTAVQDNQADASALARWVDDGGAILPVDTSEEAA